jgi:hypothetical protein
MRCLACGKRIGILRRLVDRRYCSDEHRSLPRKSARLLRDLADREELEEPWLISEVVFAEPKRPNGTLAAVGILLLACLVVLLLVVGPGSEPAPRGLPWPAPFGLPERFERALPATPPLKLREDFHSGLSAWVNPAGGKPDWLVERGGIRPGRLLLWKPTLALRNYEFAFQGEIERKAVAWVFRASDAGNYYAVKIRAEEREAGGAAIERWVVSRGERSELVRLPLPVRLRPHEPFQVSVRVRADQFVTLVDGQVVDRWRDARHARGGVGFFTDPGEEALLRWVRIRDTSSLWERVRLWTLILAPLK